MINTSLFTDNPRGASLRVRIRARKAPLPRKAWPSYAQRFEKAWPKVSYKVCLRAKWPIRPALNSGFRSTKRLGTLLLPSGWDASPSQGYSPALRSPVPIYTPGWREKLWNKVSCLRKQHDGRDQAIIYSNCFQLLLFASGKKGNES